MTERGSMDRSDYQVAADLCEEYGFSEAADFLRSCVLDLTPGNIVSVRINSMQLCCLVRCVEMTYDVDLLERELLVTLVVSHEMSTL